MLTKRNTERDKKRDRENIPLHLPDLKMNNNSDTISKLKFVRCLLGRKSKAAKSQSINLE